MLKRQLGKNEDAFVEYVFYGKLWILKLFYFISTSIPHSMKLLLFISMNQKKYHIFKIWHHTKTSIGIPANKSEEN